MISKIFIISAPSGTGKTSLVNALLNTWKGSCTLERIITYTTRTKRADEIDSKDYYFITQKEFKKKIQENFFLEWNVYCNNFYGSPSSLLHKRTDSKKHFFLIIDQNGAHAFKNIPESVFIWINPPNLTELEHRINTRTHNNIDNTERFKKAQQEYMQENQESFFKYHLINDNFQKTLEDLIYIINQEIKNF